MKRLSILAVLLVVPVRAGEWSVWPVADHLFGSTLYRLEAPAGSETDFSGNVLNFLVKSELEYPLDILRIGAGVRYSLPAASAKGPFDFEVMGWYGLTQPRGAMYDLDWVGLETMDITGQGKTLFKFSSTVSDAAIGAFGGEAAVRLPGISFFKRRWHPGVRYRFDYYEYDITGISGWQYGIADTTADEPEKIEFSGLYADTSVLSYEVMYHSLSVFNTWHPWNRENLDWFLEAEFSPLTFAWDEDYHLLRNKKVNSATWGIALGLDSRFTWDIAEHLRLDCSAGARYIRTSGAMEQYWYEDESYYDEDGDSTVVLVEKGTAYDGIDAWINSLTGRVRLVLAYLF